MASVLGAFFLLYSLLDHSLLGKPVAIFQGAPEERDYKTCFPHKFVGQKLLPPSHTWWNLRWALHSQLCTQPLKKP